MQNPKFKAQNKSVKLKTLLISGFGFVFCILYFAFSSAVWASPLFQIYSPRDRLSTFDNIIKLDGFGKNLVSLAVNDVPLNMEEDGKFSCGLVLREGKNLVQVSAQNKQGNNFYRKIRILKLNNYPDIGGHWAENKIIYLGTLGVIEGYPDGNFYPNNDITRGELASWLARAKKLPLPDLSKDPFLDVPKEHWRASAIAAVFAKGYMREIVEGYFGIDEPVMRATAASIASRVEGINVSPYSEAGLFQDVSKDTSDAAAICAAKRYGLINGVSKIKALFQPYRNLTRAEAATLLSRFIQTQKVIRNLANFDQGFNKKVYTKLNVAPAIEWFTIEPASINVNTETVFKLRAQIASRKGFYPVSKVKVDLSSVGGETDIEMFDDATFGDEIAGDGIYSLNLKLILIESGEKVIKMTAVDTFGWEANDRVALWVVE